MSEWNPTTLRQMQDAKPVAVSQNEKPVPGGAPVYEVLARSYIGGRIVEPGERVPYQWRPGQFLKHASGPTWDEWRKAHPEFDPEASPKGAAQESSSSGEF